MLYSSAMWRVGYTSVFVLRVTLCLVLHRVQLPAHDVHLRVRDGEDVAVCVSRA